MITRHARLVLGVTLILIGVVGLSLVGGGGSAPPRVWGEFDSNGEQIYYTGVSRRTGQVPFRGGPMWLRMRGGGCVACHGVDGRGGRPVMMGGKTPSDIRYDRLTEGAHEGHGPAEAEHPPYTDALIERAITEGVDPAGRPLDRTMPRWRLSDGDVEDLLAYLRTLR